MVNIFDGNLLPRVVRLNVREMFVKLLQIARIISQSVWVLTFRS